MKKDGLDDYSKEIIDRVLAGLDGWARGKMWQVVSSLNSEMMLRGTDAFKIPRDKFERARVRSEDFEAILENLDRKEILSLERKVGGTSRNSPQNAPRMAIYETTAENPDIVRREDTEVRLYKQKFLYFRDKLMALVHKETDSNESSKKGEPSEVCECRGLKYDVRKCLLNYGGKEPIEYSPDNRTIKFFLALYNQSPNVVHYKDIARDTGAEEYRRETENDKLSHDQLDNKNYSQDCNLLRRDFRSLATKAGMPKEEFKKMVINLKNVGYKLTCSTKPPHLKEIS